ncbi:MAG: polyphosphate kinase 1 [Bacteroidales bacterium]|nr:polyphosphate kinase 1 [Bacteroidales bacterium]
MIKKEHFINREISWLSFNERVLQEAMDKSVTLGERIRFLGIFSNNQDEFFRVRVAAIRRMVSLGKKSKDFLGNKTPVEIQDEIQKKVISLQNRFQKTYINIIDELKNYNINVINEKQLDKEQGKYVKKLYKEKIRSALFPVMLKHSSNFPFLKDRSIYSAIKLFSKDETKKAEFALIEIPTNELSRFILLPEKNGKKYIIILDDLIRYCLEDIFSIFDFKKIEAFTIKVTRDAELNIDDDISKSFMEKISSSLKKRKSGAPVRMVYDADIPGDLLNYIKRKMKLDDQDNLIPGARYHNFKDFIDFSDIIPDILKNSEIEPVINKSFSSCQSMLDVIKKKDVMLFYPYHSFSHLLDMLREAAIDPNVTSIKITLYRVAGKSKVINSLISAARNGKSVTVVVELQARFDEKANIKWSNTLQEEGITVIHGIQGLKIHCKLVLINRKVEGITEHFVYIGTGNFQESTARIYSDQGLFTTDRRITTEVVKMFQFFKNNYKHYDYEHLIVSPYSTRKRFLMLIDKEIENAKSGKKAYAIIKLNSLVDVEMIKKLYEASCAGVKIKLIIRGVCSLMPGVPGLSDNIEIISIIDKFLEHSRIFVFCNNGDEIYYISSADWMIRNLDNRIEVSCPVYDKNLQADLKKMLEIQMTDNTKARIINKKQDNLYKKKRTNKTVRAQVDFYNYLKSEK